MINKFDHEMLAPDNKFVASIPLDDRLYLANLPSQFTALAQKYGLDTLQKGLRSCSRPRRSARRS